MGWADDLSNFETDTVCRQGESCVRGLRQGERRYGVKKRDTEKARYERG